jgi:hypothetical protein
MTKIILQIKFVEQRVTFDVICQEESTEYNLYGLYMVYV